MSQKTSILTHLKHKPITPREALDRYGCFRLASVIHRLRDAGLNIETEMVEEGNSHFARYSLK